MVEVLLYLLFFALLALAALAGYWMLRGTLEGQSPMVALFGTRPEKRLSVVEHASLDGRRRLVLVRRDNVEHLIMTGGPVDVVIETGIDAARLVAAEMSPETVDGEAPKSTSFFSRITPKSKTAAE